MVKNSYSTNSHRSNQESHSPQASGSSTIEQIEARLSEAYDELWDTFVDPSEAFRDADGTVWDALGGGGGLPSAAGTAFRTETELAQIRAKCRRLALENEFAINGHENRISFIIGKGHTYRATARKGVDAPAKLLGDCQAVLDEFLSVNKWHQRQQEIVRRRDRDGEAFLRFFVAVDGILRIRFVEPGQVFTPREKAGDTSATFGIQTERDDVEAVTGFYVDGLLVVSGEIQHRKAHVDSNVKRGVPLFYPVAKNLQRAEKLLRNMSVVAGIQSAIALIRKHQRGTTTTVEQFRSGAADASQSDSATGKTRYFQQFRPGTIIDAAGGIEYDFPTQAVNATNFVPLLQAELRAVASRLVMPEFMLTSDASNANYASTLVAEGPAVRMFERLQHDMIVDDAEVMRRVIAAAVEANRLPAEALTQVDVKITPPSLAVRDELQDARRRRIEASEGILSPQTWSQLAGLDYDQEQANRATHERRREEGV